MRLIKPETNEYPAYPVGEDIDGYSVVVESQPEFDPETQFAIELMPEFIDGEWRQRWEISALDPVNAEEALSSARTAKLSEILSKSDYAQLELYSNYSAGEKLSWSRQEEEARELLADENAAAPLLRVISSVRGMDLTELRDKVLANAQAYAQSSGSIIGQQQRFEDMVKAATTAAEVNDITVSYT